MKKGGKVGEGRGAMRIIHIHQNESQRVYVAMCCACNNSGVALLPGKP
jgi:hypothetical protein